MNFISAQARHPTRPTLFPYTTLFRSHSGHLWSSGGTLLAAATFSGETASGWQQAKIRRAHARTPVTKEARMHSTAGERNAVDQNAFNASIDRTPLHAPSNGASGGNGV